MPSTESLQGSKNAFALEVRYGAQLPSLSRKLSRALAPINRFFDWLYHSNYNPLYRSGTLAIGFLSVMIVSGVYLLCFYSVSDPHGSVTRISNQKLGGFLRAVHRYSADLTLLAIAAHILQLVAQGKTWGPRTRAWLSGLLVTGTIFLSAFSGFILIWDLQGQLFAYAGSQLFGALPFLKDTLDQAFDGSSAVGAAFFFVNLFLHAALPLLVVFGLWVHTSKLARTRWFPVRPIFGGALVALAVLALVSRPPLQEKADLLQSIGQVKLDWWYGFWISGIEYLTPPGMFVLLCLVGLTLFTVPWWLRPQNKTFSSPSVVDEARCTGCMQCANDCPWEAITMVPRPDGRRLLAQVSADACVSCGICAGSCGDKCIGPPRRDSLSQLAGGKEFVANHPAGGVCVITCCNNGRMQARLASAIGSEEQYCIFPVECCGTIHSDVSELLLSHFTGLAFVGCPVRNCMNRDGLDLLSGRTYARRVPFLSREIGRERIFLTALSDGEAPELLNKLKIFRETGDSFKAHKADGSLVRLVSNLSKRIIATAALLAGVVYVGVLPYGQNKETSIVRLSLRLPSATATECRPLTEEEKAAVPRHMQVPQICASKPIKYSVRLAVDNEPLFESELSDPAGRDDRPIVYSKEKALPPGKRNIAISISSDTPSLEPLTYQAALPMEAGRIYLFRSTHDTRGIFLVES